VRGGKRILVVVPARGGSKGVLLKNLQPVGGVPLVARVGALVSELPWVDRAVVSTDHAKIADVARKSGLDAPFIRPESLSGDRIGDLEVLTHALTTVDSLEGSMYDVVVMLQPTSPLRSAEHVQATVDKLVEGSFDAVWTVSPTDVKYHPRKQLVLDGDQLGFFSPDGAEVIARQQLGPVYHRNGAAYAITRECLLLQKSILGENASAASSFAR
jgi:CMP-N,N'-diacetyllegionaminic acid synthase